MTIILITQEQYDRLLHLYTTHPNLTYENKGYDEIDKSKLSPEDISAFKEVESVLSKAIKGFVRFQNFRTREHGVQLRFQYDWSADDTHPPIVRFTGVGFLMLHELLNGFDKIHRVT